RRCVPGESRANERSGIAPKPLEPRASEKIRVVGRSGRGPDRGRRTNTLEKATRRGNYDSGSDYVLEYGELRFSFNEEDFAQRVEQAAVKLDFVEGSLGGAELQDLLELAVNGEISEPTSSLGEHINEHWTE